MNKALATVFCLIGTLFWADEVHKFSGKHFVASYLGCDSQAISDVDNLLKAMESAVLSSGATILNESHFVFEPNGLTVVYLLSESHASLHTYPEYGACFVDLFTCGDNCSTKNFDEALRSYLNPTEINARFFLRSQDTTEAPY